MKNIIMFAAIALFTSSVFAQQETYEGDGISMWYDSADEDNPNRTELFIDSHGTIASMDLFQMLDLNHTWVGGLVIKLTHKDTGTSVTMLDRPGYPEFSLGDSADFAGNYDWIDGGFIYDADIYGAFVPDDVIMGPVSGELADFAGENKFGTWSLTIEDYVTGEVGSLDAWSFTITLVPTPSALAFLAMTGFIWRRSRNRT